MKQTRFNIKKICAMITITIATANALAADTTNTAPQTRISFDAALSVGGIPVFDTWQNTLPRTLQDLELDPQYPDNTGNNEFLKFRVTESPDNFNYVVPFGVYLHRSAHDHTWSFGASFYQTSKQYQAELYIDDVVGEDEEIRRRRIELQESATFTSIALEVAYKRIIPPTYFSISGSERTTLALAAGISPLTFFDRSGSMRVQTSEDDERINAVAEHVRERGGFSNLTASGLSLSWRMGISSQRSRGFEVGIYYGGTYSFNFTENGKTVNASAISGLAEDDKPLSFMTNQIELRISFLRPLGRSRVVDNVVDDVIISDEVVDNQVDDDIISENGEDVVDDDILDNEVDGDIIDDDVDVDDDTNSAEEIDE